ncbi:hypothetical protein SKAU_G00170400 [Synaphobranchus kaupii]|uniref:Uncharacterized protein n=1 Tax=Synaphobranchus kaupii TaxID=118154 RepID=A0A9Q1FKW7_SYNKA|nr:hypothetical protein SKAU_G00170400 [Synaphobranchus kaupii]
MHITATRPFADRVVARPSIAAGMFRNEGKVTFDLLHVSKLGVRSKKEEKLELWDPCGPKSHRPEGTAPFSHGG